MDWRRFSNPVQSASVEPLGYHAVQILIDRDRTNAARQQYGGDSAIAARFDEPVTLHRVLDGEELALIYASGYVEGGMFATPEERAHGASWAAAEPEALVQWGRGWQKSRLGKDLFVARIDGKGRWFYHMVLGKRLDFDPAGGDFQAARVDPKWCDTGLGCSLRVPRQSVEFSRVLPNGKIAPMSDEQIRAYLARKPQKPVMLRSLGGMHAVGGTILGHTVVVKRDQHDKLWSVRDRDERVFVVGARSKKQAVDVATRILRAGPARLVRLNTVPLGFDAIQRGQVWERVLRGWPPDRDKIRVQEIGPSYVAVASVDGAHYFDIDAKPFLSEYRRAA